MAKQRVRLGRRNDGRTGAIVVALSACLGLFACTSSSGSSTAPAGSPSAASTSSAPAEPDISSVDGRILGSGTYPVYTLDVPAGWRSDGVFTVDPGLEAVGVSVWDVGQVPRDPCKWKSTLATPEATVDDLAEALTAQKYRDATEPTPVTVGGVEGLHLEWSVPADWRVTGDSDFEGCDDPGNGHEDFVSWHAVGGEGERYQQAAGQVDMLWILDVDGHPYVVDATYTLDATEADRRELLQIVESLRFTD